MIHLVCNIFGGNFRNFLTKEYQTITSIRYKKKAKKGKLLII